MSVSQVFILECDHDGCLVTSGDKDDIADTTHEAKSLGIAMGWQVVTRDGVQLDFCPAHHRPSPKSKPVRR